MSTPSAEEVAQLLSQWTAPFLIDHLLADASDGSYRIRRQEAVHQLMNLLPALPAMQQVGALRRLRQLIARSVYNLHVCTAQLHLISTLLGRLHPMAPPPTPAVCDEVLELLGLLGSHRANRQELRALFQLIRLGLRPQQGSATLPSHKDRPASSALVTPSELSTDGANPTLESRLPHASPERLLQLLLRWCNVRQEGPGLTGPSPPLSFFDVDDCGSGISFPPPLAQEMLARPAFALSCWLRLEAPPANRSEMLFSCVERREEAGLEAGFEILLQRSLQQITICVYTASKPRRAASTLDLLRRSKQSSAEMPAPERVSLGGVELQGGRWHQLVLCFRKVGVGFGWVGVGVGLGCWGWVIVWFGAGVGVGAGDGDGGGVGAGVGVGTGG